MAFPSTLFFPDLIFASGCLYDGTDVSPDRIDAHYVSYYVSEIDMSLIHFIVTVSRYFSNLRTKLSGIHSIREIEIPKY